MNNPDSVAVVNRFFESLDAIVERKVIRGKLTFVRRYGINNGNFYQASKNPQSKMFEVSWLTYMTKDFGVSADWLLTGKGAMFGGENRP